MKLNDELIQLYIKGISEDCFSDDFLTIRHFGGILRMYELEKYDANNRNKNPEWAEALKVLNSPLMKALS